jgi:hypothetical protein
VLQAATGRSDRDALLGNRGWSEDEWSAAVDALQARGWVDGEGAVTDAGRVVREDVEAATDRLAAPIVAGIGDDGAIELVSLLRPLAEAVMDAGAVPPLNNMGVPWPPTTG